MNLESVICWLRAETHIHVGAGETASLIDLPFMREAGTSYPYIPGSGMKGAWRDGARSLVGGDKPDDSEFVKWLFGRTEDSGKLLFSDARLVLLPLRALHQAFVLVTCPHLLRRLQRDLDFAGHAPDGADFSFLEGLRNPADTPALYASTDQRIVVEDHLFKRQGDDTLWVKAKTALDLLLSAIPKPERGEIIERGVIVSDAAFGHFARRALHVRMRNKLTPETKIVDRGMLWSEESLPPETIMLHAAIPRDPKNSKKAVERLGEIWTHAHGYLQVGGNETVGEGWFKVVNDIGSATAAKKQGEAKDAA